MILALLLTAGLSIQAAEPAQDGDFEAALFQAYDAEDLAGMARLSVGDATQSTMRGLVASALGEDGLVRELAIRQADRQCGPGTSVSTAHLATELSSARLVIVNEAHQNTVHRAVVFDWLGDLRAHGFTHFLFEGFIPEARADELASAFGLSAQEARAMARSSGVSRLDEAGHMTSDMVQYHGDPVLHRLVARARTLGFELGDFEARIGQGPGTRSQSMAQNIAAILNADPAARLIVLTGHGHAYEQVPHMTGWLKAETGIDPITLIQTICTPRETGPTVLIHEATQGEDPFDYLVSHRFWQATPHAWRAELLGDHPVSAADFALLDLHAVSLGVLEAFAQGAPEGAAPLDRVLVHDGALIRPLYVPPGVSVDFKMTVADEVGAP